MGRPLLPQSILDLRGGLHARITDPSGGILADASNSAKVTVLLLNKLAQKLRPELRHSGLCVTATQSAGGRGILQNGILALLE